MTTWRSKTGCFGVEEMGSLETLQAEALAAMLLRSDPIVVLRALAEIMLNGDEGKLKTLLAIKRLTAHWETYTQDYAVTASDHVYAQQLRAKLPTT